MESLKDALKLKDEETAQLRHHLGLTSDPNSSPPQRTSDLHRQAHSLRQQVKDMDKANNSLKQQLVVNGDVEGADAADQITRMTAEIERLRADNTRLASQLLRAPADGQGRATHSGAQDMLLTGDECDGNGTLSEAVWRNGHVSDSQLSTLPAQLYPGDLSRNTNRRTESSHSSITNPALWDSFARSASQSSQSESEWAPRLMGGEDKADCRNSRLAKMRVGSSDSASSLPLVNVGRRLQESQEQVGVGGLLEW